MAARDVEIIIRAKDEATKVVAALDKAIEGFAGSAKGAEKISASAAAAFGALASGFKQIDTAIRGVTSIERLQKNLATAEQASERLKTETAETAAGIGKLEDELQKASLKAVDYANKLDAAKKATADQKAAINDTIAARKLDATSIAGSVAAYAKLETAQKNSGTAVDNLTQQLAKAEARFAEVSTQIAGVEKPTKRLQGSFDSAGRAVEDYRAKLAQAVAEQTSVAQTLAAQARAVEQQKEAYDKSEKVLVERQKTLKELQAIEKAAAQSSRETASIEAGYARSLKDQESALAKRNAEIEQSIPALAQLRAETLRGVEAQNQFAGQAQGGFIQALRQQQSTFDQLRQVYAETRTQLAQLSAAIGNVGAPTQEMVTQQNALRAVLAQVATSVKEEGAVLQTMREAYRNLGSDSASLSGTQKDFAANLRNSGKALADNAKAADSASAAAARTVAAQAQVQRAAGAEAERAAKALEAQRIETELATKAQEEFAAQARGGFIAAIREQQSNVDKLKGVFAETRASLKELSAAIGATGVPTEAMVAQQNNLRTVLATVATQVKEEAAVLSGLRTDFQNLGTDTASIAASQKEFATATANSTKALQTSATASEKARNAASGTVAVQRQIQQAYAGLAVSAEEAAHSNDDLSEAYKRQANASRTALSFAQRLRGEVLSLVAAYTGFYGVIQILGQTVTAYQTLEAAQSRLNAVDNNDQVKVGQDLDFVRRQADRLGIQFGTLADEYTKFAASTVNTVIAGQKTRDIFLSIAEAGRVNKLSLEDMSGIFKAVTQIASKGKFQLEELSGQLGDRLPGALQILADALNVTKEQLLAMTKNGDVLSEKLNDFADQLDKRYGGALAASLKTTTTAIGQLGNSANQALVAFGKGGFIAGFTDLVRKLNETLKDPAFLTFVQNLSTGFGAIASALGVLVENFRTTGAAILAFAGIKFAPLIGSWGLALYNLGNTGVATAAKVNVFTTAAATGGAAAAEAAVGVTLFGRALAFATSATGVGLAITAAAVAVEYFSTSANLANTVLTEHNRIVDQVKNAYDSAKGSADKFAASLKNLTVTEVNTALTKAVQNLQQQRENAVTGARGLTANSNSVFGQLFNGKEYQNEIAGLKQLTEQFAAGKITVNDYKTSLEILHNSTKDAGLKELTATYIENAEGTRQAADQVEHLQLVMKILTTTGDEQKAAIDKLNGVVHETKDAHAEAATAAQTFKDAMDEMADATGRSNQELKALKENLKLDEAFSKAVNAAKSMGQLNQAISEYNKGVNEITGKNLTQSLSGFSTGKEAAMELIRRRESIDYSARYDVNHFRVGYGSDTVTNQDGSFRPVTPNDTVTRADAERDLSRRVDIYMKTLTDQIGPAFSQFSAAQQAAVTSFAYNYTNTGNLAAKKPDVLKALQSGDQDAIAGAIRGTQYDNNSVNQGRRLEEASAFDSSAALEQQTKEVVKAQQAQEKLTASGKEYIQGLKDETDLTAAKGTADERKLYIQQEINKEIKSGNLDASNKQQIDEATILIGKKYDQINAEKQLKDAKKETNAEEKAANEKSAQTMANINSLNAQRLALETQLKAQQKAGDTTGLEQTKSQLADINKQLVDAINNAIAMYEAIGGPDAQAKIGTLNALKTRLDAAEISGDNFKKKGKEAEDQWTKVGELFLNGLVGAFDQFAQAVANGENVAEAAREAFLKFASDFLIEIGKMILRQALLNLLQGIFPGLGAAAGGAATGVSVALHHSGGLANDNSRTRTVSPSLFAGAPRFHTGQVGVGLQSGEVAAILQKREEVLAADDPRNILNGGAAAGGQQQQGGKADPKVKIINLFDPLAAFQEAMTTADGERAIVNAIARNASTVKQALS